MECVDSIPKAYTSLSSQGMKSSEVDYATVTFAKIDFLWRRKGGGDIQVRVEGLDS